ncbi:S-layer homology domain-containing protein [Tumebacillus sp. ITR2]|uniref:S-layer homology domain-containing protein n=1 Tax=Tumebacillus amylolyticus TaxID=2801339 RepID=A0ABS1J7P5_9BACL|nr:S-layer homology domain-containing protein [Tumebacillus amylolyticus]MBL0386290.1 S-layer homology domain-containing protein [Tumebacillus amylolyticus]
MFRKHRLHKVTCTLLACTLLGSPMMIGKLPAAYAESTVATHAAAPAVSKEQAVETARTVMKLTQDSWKLSTFEYRSNASDKWGNANGPRWQLEFTPVDPNTHTAYSVVIDGKTGQMIGMNFYNKMDPQAGDATQEQARKAGEAFLAQVAPDELKQAELTTSEVNSMGASKSFNFTYVRKTADGVYVLGDRISLTMAGNGNLISYEIHWSNADFPKPNGTVSVADANKSYADALGLRLMYQQQYRTATPTMSLVYGTDFSQNFMFPEPLTPYLIDAKSGKAINRNGDERKPTSTVQKPIVENGPTAPTPRNTPLTQEEAEDLLLSSGLLHQGDQLQDPSYQESSPTNKTWSFSVSANGSKKPTGNVFLDALTGEVISYNTFSVSSTSSEPAMTSDAITQKAMNLVKKLYPGRMGLFSYVTTATLPNSMKGSDGESTGVSFTYLKNGVPSQYGLQIIFDRDGNVTNFYGQPFELLTSDKTDYPDPSKAITLEQATSTYIQKRPLRLSYYFPILADGTQSTQPMLVWAPKDNDYPIPYVDALTNEYIDTDLSQVKPSAQPTDIKDHWAEKALTQFADRGLLDIQDGKAYPNNEISRAEYIRLLTNFRVGLSTTDKPTFEDVPTNSKYFNSIETAVFLGWIAKDKTFRPDDKISRQEAASILTRVLGYQDLAKHTEIFALPYSDGGQVASYAKGSVAILTGLGVMTGSANEFRPTGDITLAEACTAILKLSSITTNFPPYVK